MSHPRARELPGTADFARKRPRVAGETSESSPRRPRRRSRANAPIAPTLPKRPACPADPPSSARAAPREAPAPGVELRGRGSAPPAGGRAEAEIAPPPGLGERPELPVERTPPVAVGKDESEQHEAQVAVQGLRARAVLQGQRADRVLELVPAPVIAVEGQVSGQAGRMGQEVLDRDGVAVAAAPRRKPAPHAVGKADPPLVDGAHHQRGRGDDLGQRREIEHRAGGGLRPARAVEAAAGVRPDDSVARAHLRRRGRKRAVRHPGGQDVAGGRQIRHAVRRVPDGRPASRAGAARRRVRGRTARRCRIVGAGRGRPDSCLRWRASRWRP